MRRLLGPVAGASVLLLTFVTAANAAVFVSSIPGAPDPGPSASQTHLITFDTGLPAGVTLSGDGAIVTGSVPNDYAEPAGDTTPFLTTPFATKNNASELDFAPFLGNQDVVSFSFYWGSIDAFNSLQLLDRSGASFFTIAGPAIPPANGNQTAPFTNRRVVFQLSGADRNLGGLIFTSTNKAFEVDTLAFQLVPEPASWAMMVLGFGGLGALLRARRRAPAATA